MSDIVANTVHTKAVIIASGAYGAAVDATAEPGTIKFSGAKLWVRGASKFEVITSA